MNSVPRTRSKAAALRRSPKSARSPGEARLRTRDVGGSGRFSAGSRWAARSRHLHPGRQRSRRYGGQFRDAVVARRPDRAWRDPGRQSAAGLHPSPRRPFHGGQDAARPPHYAIRFCRHQPRGRRRHLGRCDKAGAAVATVRAATALNTRRTDVRSECGHGNEHFARLLIAISLAPVRVPHWKCPNFSGRSRSSPGPS